MSTKREPLFARDPDASIAVGAALILGLLTVGAVLIPWLDFF